MTYERALDLARKQTIPAWLYGYESGRLIRRASPEEAAQSVVAAHEHGGEGVFETPAGLKVYVWRHM